MPAKPTEASSGTQSIERAILILRHLASSNFSEGMRFTDLADATGLNNGTLYRILRTLRREGFVEQHKTTRLYYLGMDFLALGTSATNRSSIRELSGPYLTELARQSDDTVFLSMRSGDDSVCIDRREGTFPIKALTLNIGSRRPLGIGAGALALLSWLPDHEVDDITGRNVRRQKHDPRFNPKIVKGWVEDSRRRGYAFNDGHFLGSMCAIGIPVLDRSGRPAAALSIAAISDRMGEARREELAALLRDAGEKVAAAVETRGVMAA